MIITITNNNNIFVDINNFHYTNQEFIGDILFLLIWGLFDILLLKVWTQTVILWFFTSMTIYILDSHWGHQTYGIK